jgi:hypothetical protein
MGWTNVYQSVCSKQKHLIEMGGYDEASFSGFLDVGLFDAVQHNG